MAKKEKGQVTEVEVIEPDTESTNKTKKQDKANDKANNKKTGKKNKDTKKGGLGKKIKESFSEIKKVSWPTFGKTVKQTGMVIGVVAICTLLLFGVDRLLGWLFTLFAY